MYARCDSVVSASKPRWQLLDEVCFLRVIDEFSQLCNHFLSKIRHMRCLCCATRVQYEVAVFAFLLATRVHRIPVVLFAVAACEECCVCSCFFLDALECFLFLNQSSSSCSVEKVK